MSDVKLTLLVGFDRSGSSMIAKLLGMHPGINLLFQPFNSTEVTKQQWEIWSANKPMHATEKFLSSLLRGVVDKSYIQSEWFHNHSTSGKVEKHKLNLIKDTKWHFQIPWLKNNFPEIKIYGIWRDPRAILCSLIRNEFHKNWYVSLSESLLASIIKSSSELDDYLPFLGSELGDYEVMALGVAIRTHMLKLYIKKDNWLIYEKVNASPNEQLSIFLDKFNLEKIDFKPYMSNDFNIVGKPYQKTHLWEEYFTSSQLIKINNIFSLLLKNQP